MKINKQRVEFYLNYIRHGGHFEINLCRYGGEVTDELSQAIVDQIVKPIWKTRTESVIFGIQRRTRGLAKPSRTKSKISLPKEVALEPDEELWRQIFEGKEGDKNWILCVAEKDIPISAIAENSWDPHYLANIGAVVSKSSLEFCREHVQSENTCCFLFYRSALGVSMSIHARIKILETLYIACVQKCRFTGEGLEKELRG